MAAFLSLPFLSDENNFTFIEMLQSSVPLMDVGLLYGGLPRQEQSWRSESCFSIAREMSKALKAELVCKLITERFYMRHV